MDRNREGRRASVVGSNGFNRRRQRTNSLRDSPDEDVGVELQESIRLRDRVKKDRDLRDRLRESDRDLRERERDLRERSRSKRRRADDSSEESGNDEDDEYEETVRPVNHHHHIGNSFSNFGQQQQQQQHSSFSNNNTNQNIVSGNSNNHPPLQHRKTFPPSSSSTSSKVFRAPPVWKTSDEMISFSVPRKARSSSTKKPHDLMSSSSNNNSGGAVAGVDQFPRQASSSPARQVPPPAGPVSPSSSNASSRKKLKHSGGNNGGLKPKPPKASSKPNSSNPEELEEIEIAEVLYGLMTQSSSQGPSPKKDEPKELNRPITDSKSSRVSSPVSNSTVANSSVHGSNISPLTVTAPKRKRPRQVTENSSYVARSSTIPGKPELDQTTKIEISISSPSLDRMSGSTAENVYESRGISVNTQILLPAVAPESTMPESMKLDSEFRPTPVVVDLLREKKDLVAKEEVVVSSPMEKIQSSVLRTQDNHADSTKTVTSKENNKVNPHVGEMENLRQDKFQIDLMAPPSPERNTRIQPIPSTALDLKPVLSNVVEKFKEKEDEKIKEFSVNVVVVEERIVKGTGEEESTSHMEIEKENNNKRRNIDLELNLEKPERDGSIGGINATSIKFPQQQIQKQKQQQLPLKAATRDDLVNEKSGQSATSAMPLPISMGSWPGGLPSMGYMAAPLQGVVPIESNSIRPSSIQLPFGQSKPKRCATHWYIARTIDSSQQMMKMNPFWPGAAATAGPTSSLFGPKPGNLGVMPSVENIGSVRSVNNVQDKGPIILSLPNQEGGKDRVPQSTTGSSTSDPAATMRKQQQQQQHQQQILFQQALPPAAAPANLLGPFIFPINQQQAAVAASARPSGGKHGGNGAAPSSLAGSTAAVGPAVSFNYPPGMAVNEQQYLALFQNSAYHPFPMQQAGNYRGAPPGQAGMPMFNGAFYPSQMIHPSQIQQHHQAPPSTQPPPPQQQLHSSGGSSSQKHFQQRPHSSEGKTDLPATHKSQSVQQAQNQQSATESDGLRGPRAALNIYGPNFSVPIHPQNFALMTTVPSTTSAALTSGNNQNEKKQQQPQSFAMSFSPAINGTTSAAAPGMDIMSIPQNHPFFQNFSPDNRQMMAAAQVAHAAQKKNFRNSEENSKTPGGGANHSSTPDSERKKAQSGGGGQSIAFSTRTDITDQPVSVVESSVRSLNSVSSSGMQSRTSQPVANSKTGNNAHIQAQIQHHQQQILKHHHQQQQQQQQTAGASASRNKAVPQVSSGSNNNIYFDQMNSSSPKFTNTLSAGFQQTNSPTQSPQWKSSARPPASQAMPSSTPTNIKSLPQQHQHPRQPHMHTQISFGGGGAHQKPSPPPNNTQAPIIVGSPTTSKGPAASGSPRTSNTSSNKTNPQAAALSSSQQPKNSASTHTQKSPSILGNPQMQKNMQAQAQAQAQAHMFFSGTYPHAQSPHSNSSTSGPAGYYMQQQRRRPDQHQQSSGTLLPAGFPYAHPIPAAAAVPVKPPEQKQPAG